MYESYRGIRTGTCQAGGVEVMVPVAEPYAFLPLVSVIVPAYNAAAYLGEAIDSLLLQTVREIEVIVVDDGSSDDTFSVASERAARDARVVVIRRTEPSGRPARARNEGLRVARGKYIALLDADDVAIPTRLESAITAILRTQADVAFADFSKFGEGAAHVESRGQLDSLGFTRRASAYLDPLGDRLFLCRPGFIAFLLADIAAINVPTVVFARSALDREDEWFNESLVGGEDLDLFFRLSVHSRVVFMDLVQTLVRVHENSLTATRSERCAIDAINVRRASLRRVQSLISGEETSRIRRSVSLSLADLGYRRWCEGRQRVAREAFRESFVVSPSTLAALGYVKALLPRAALIRLSGRTEGVG